MHFHQHPIPQSAPSRGRDHAPIGGCLTSLIIARVDEISATPRSVRNGFRQSGVETPGSVVVGNCLAFGNSRIARLMREGRLTAALRVLDCGVTA